MILPRRNPRPRAGLSRTDVLAILAVASVLAALVAAPLAHAKRKARAAQCLSNLQQVGRAILLYAEDEKSLPGPSPALPRDLWWAYKEQVKGRIGLTGESSAGDTVFACPDDRGYTDPRPFSKSERFGFSSYVFNGVTLPGAPSIAGWPVSSVKQPKRTLLVMEWTAHAPLSWHRSGTGKKNAPFYNNAESIAAFVDGHVSMTKIYYDGCNAAYTQDPIAGYDYQYSGN